jgi:hypothetical protein
MVNTRSLISLRSSTAPTAVIVALCATATTVRAQDGATQIPEKAQWEITFAQVEASAGLSDLRTVSPETVEARLMERPWSAVAPLPFLRLVRADGTVRAQLFVFWAPRFFAPGRQPTGPDIVCRDGVCVRPIDIKEQRDWGEVVASLADQNACPTKNSGVVPVCADCDQIWIKTAANGHYREQSCQVPGSDTAAGALLQLMKRSAQAAGQ